jgi:hydroxyethylthiazole kinase-like uncharacterized protein yjeF
VTESNREETVAVENRARTEALRILKWARHGGDAERSVDVFAGRTTSGACAMALARHVHNYGIPVRTYVCGPLHRVLPSATVQYEILSRLGLDVFESSDVTRIRDAVEGGIVDRAIVDGAGDSFSPGAEEAFANAVRADSAHGLRVTLAGVMDERTPAPAEGDMLFEPEAAPRSREDVRLLDGTAINHYGIPGLSLMENAGWRTAREAYRMLGDSKGRVVVAAGAGNNGGDGFCAARHLAWWGVDVEVVLVSMRAKLVDDAKDNMEMAEENGVRVKESLAPEVVAPSLTSSLEGAALVLDALVGTGLAGKVRGGVAEAIGVINASGLPVLAVDTPSGLDANTGAILGAAVKAQRTVTFAFTKPGFFLEHGRDLVGDLVVADISLPRVLWACSDDA